MILCAYVVQNYFSEGTHLLQIQPFAIFIDTKFKQSLSLKNRKVVNDYGL